MFTISTNLFYILFFVLIFLIFIIVGIFVLYLRLINNYLAIRELRKKDVDPMTLLADAHKRAEEIIIAAQKQAYETVNSAQKLTAEQQTKIDLALNKVSGIYANKYQEELTKISDESVKMVRNIPEDIKTQINQQVQIFKVDLQHELAKTQQEVRDAMTQSYKMVEDQIGKYKREQIAIVDNSIGKIVEDVARRVLHKEISTEEHEKLVIHALNEAKKNNFL